MTIATPQCQKGAACCAIRFVICWGRLAVMYCIHTEAGRTHPEGTVQGSPERR